jgi:hypothetical protein
VAVVREATAGISREQDFLLVEGRSLKQAGEERVQFATPAKGITLTIADGRVSIAGDMDETVFPVHLNCGPLLRAFVNNKAAKIVAGTKVEL